ncbi:hypothetical protein Micbo1qcDRAFT_178669 [Microdochium bolleyi]|uniref:Uncharacterized protein n=1 Tax=Microdochium bolleyi TaxID=196109 RepID=A0A136ISU2_9PEZI|nr:hypothetical protein Micbo1qcDRAFT_178669 [Microdochium bolleyi]
MHLSKLTLAMCLASGGVQATPVEPRGIEEGKCALVKSVCKAAKQEPKAIKYCESVLPVPTIYTTKTKYEPHYVYKWTTVTVTDYKWKTTTSHEIKKKTVWTTKTGDPQFPGGSCYSGSHYYQAREAEAESEANPVRRDALPEPTGLVSRDAEEEARSLGEEFVGEEARSVEEQARAIVERTAEKPPCLNHYGPGPAITAACKCLYSPHPVTKTKWITVPTYVTKVNTKTHTDHKYKTKTYTDIKWVTTTKTQHVPGPTVSCFVLRNKESGKYAKAQASVPGSKFKFDVHDVKQANQFKLDGKQGCKLIWAEHPQQNLAAYPKESPNPGIVKLFKQEHGAEKLSAKIDTKTGAVTVYPASHPNSPYKFAVNYDKNWIETDKSSYHGYDYGQLVAKPVVCKSYY